MTSTVETVTSADGTVIAFVRTDDGPGDTTTPVCINLSAAAAESVPAHEADQLYTTIRHARIPAQRAAQFWERAEALIREFTQLPCFDDVISASPPLSGRPTTC
jgi:hypothetical protein